LCRRDDPDPALRAAYARFSALDRAGQGHIEVADLQRYLDRVRGDRALLDALTALAAPEPTPTPVPPTPTPAPPTPTPVPPTPTPVPPTPTPGPFGTPPPPTPPPPPPPTPEPRPTPIIFLGPE
jgi:hypothetical protein